VNEDQQSWYKISKTEFFVALLPPAVAFVLAIMFYGNDEDPMYLFAHSFVALLTLPGVVLLMFARLLFQFGSLHGDKWNLLSIPLSAILMLLAVRGWQKVRRLQSRRLDS